MQEVDRAYLDLVQRILQTGEVRPTRTGEWARSLFGESLHVPLDPFPILQVKRVFFRGVVEELLWFLRGSTSADSLREKGVRIWDANATRTFLDERGLSEYPEGELGPVYGWQWRRWGANYPDPSGGCDQIERIVHQLNTDPHSRRIVLQAWNVADLDRMALPPCHMMAQFSVRYQRKLDCHVYQRSCDVGLGLPFNLASYGLLTHLLAHITGYDVGTLHMSFGDTHVYDNHEEPLRSLLDVSPSPCTPRLSFACAPKTDPAEYAYEDLRLDEYQPCSSVYLPMNP